MYNPRNFSKESCFMFGVKNKGFKSRRVHKIKKVTRAILEDNVKLDLFFVTVPPRKNPTNVTNSSTRFDKARKLFHSVFSKASFSHLWSSFLSVALLSKTTNSSISSFINRIPSDNLGETEKSIPLAKSRRLVGSDFGTGMGEDPIELSNRAFERLLGTVKGQKKSCTGDALEF